MIVTNLLNETELLTDCNEISIERKLGGEHTIQFTAYRTDNNNHAYDLLQDDSLIEGANETFVVKDVDETPFNKNIIAINSFFECIDDYVEELWPNGLYTIQESLQHAFLTSEWTYLIDGNYPQRARLEEFGNDNAVSMLNKILSAFNSEYEIDSSNKRIIVKRRLGFDTDYQIRDRHNITSINRAVDAKNVKTAVKVFYNLDEFGNYNSSVIYYSPNRSKYRKTKWREPIYGDNITTEEQAISTARLILKDTPDITFNVEFTTLQDMGYNSNEVQLGNGVFLIDERLGIESIARIVAIREFYKQVNGQLVKDINHSPIVTISNIQKTVSSALVQQQQQQAQIERTAVKQQNIYNGCTISKEDGFKAVALNGVETTLNASEGISVKRNGELKFFVDANNDELTMDGRLHLTDNGNTMVESFMDTNGGILRVYDIEGNLNAEVGSNKLSSQNLGGAVRIYGDSFIPSERVSLSVDKGNDSGEIKLSNDSSVFPTLELSANVDIGSMLKIFDNDRVQKTHLGTDVGFINESRIITEEILFPLLNLIYEELNNLQDEIDNLKP